MNLGLPTRILDSQHFSAGFQVIRNLFRHRGPQKSKLMDQSLDLPNLQAQQTNLIVAQEDSNRHFSAVG
jgi:hypothetical protein